MKISRIGASVAVTLALALTACSNGGNGGSSASPAASGTGSATTATLQGTISGGGATSQEAAMTAWISGFKATQPNMTVQYKAEGSGAGRKGFLAGQYAFAGSDSSLSKEEYESSKQVCGPDGAVQIPGYISPIAVTFNLEGVKNVKMDADTIAKVLKGDIKTWNDKAIADQNPGVTLPDTKITVVNRSDESGTTKNFTQYLAAAAKTVWTYEADEKWPLPGESAQGTSGVVQLIQSTPGAIGYADASAIGDLGTVEVKVGTEYVALSEAAAAKVVEVSPKKGGGAPGDMAISLQRDTTEAGAYPIVLVSYHIYCTTYTDQNTVDMVKAFAHFVTSPAGQEEAGAAAGNAPLSKSLSDEAAKVIDSIKKR